MKVLNGGLTDKEIEALENYLLDNRIKLGFVQYSYAAIIPILVVFGVNEDDVKCKQGSIVTLANTYYYYCMERGLLDDITPGLFMKIAYVYAVENKISTFEELAGQTDADKFDNFVTRCIYEPETTHKYHVEYGIRLEEVVYEEDGN